MSWDVEYTDEFGEWWDGLDPGEQNRIVSYILLLQERGPALGRPEADTLQGSRHPNMKELRPLPSIRVLFAFDPRRVAILLIGGDKRHRWTSWYREMIPVADRLYDEYLDELRREGLL